MDIPTAATLIVGIRTFGPSAAKVVEQFLTGVLAPAARAMGKDLEAGYRDWQQRRIERGQQLAYDSALMLEQAGVEPQPVPGRVLWPILEKGSLEEDDSLRRRWAALLANAADSRRTVEITPALVQILAELTPFEAAVLEANHERARGGYRFGLPAGSQRSDYELIFRHFLSLGLLDEQLEYAVEIDAVEKALHWTDRVLPRPRTVRVVSKRHHEYRLSTLAFALLRACTPPAPTSAPSAEPAVSES